jgi:hypothetical protein
MGADDNTLKIKQLLSGDRTNVKLGMELAESIGMTDDEMISLFTKDDMTGGLMYADLNCFNFSYTGFTREHCYERYLDHIKTQIKILRNE